MKSECYSILLINGKVSIAIKMACEQCGTVVVYGKRKKTKRRLCIDCWKIEDSEQKEEKSSNDIDRK